MGFIPLLLIAASVALAGVPADLVERQAVLLLEKGAKVEALKHALPEGCELMDQTQNLAVVRCSETIDEPALKRLEKLPGVEGVKVDAPVVRQGETPGDKPCCEKLNVPDPIGAGAKVATNVAKALSCPLGEKCPEGKLPKLWAQTRVDADLMATELTRMGIKPGHTKVAVVDTGIDLEKRGDQFSRKIEAKKGYPGAGDPKADHLGHGTMVASTIGGAGGVGVAPDVDLSVYRVAAPNAKGDPSSATLFAAMDRACADGNEIINVSYSALVFVDKEEVGRTLLAPNTSKTDRALIQRFADRGCMIVAGAGNSGRDDRKGSFDPDDAFMSVEASDPDARLGFISNRGEMSAPGMSVFVVSSSAEGNVQKGNCGVGAGQQVDGTSFASPITAGITAEVLGVLKSGTRYATLSKPDRIKLLNRIVGASHTYRNVSGLRAVLIAERWNAAEGLALPIPAERDFRKLLEDKPPGFCEGERKSCLGLEACGDLKTCHEAVRRRMSVCPVMDKVTVQDAVNLAVMDEDFGTAAYWIGYVTDAHKNPAELVGEGARRVLDHYVLQWTKVEPREKWQRDPDFSTELGIAADLLPAVLGLGQGDEAALRMVLNRTLVSHFLGLGGNEKSVELSTSIRRIYRSLLWSQGKEGLLKAVHATLRGESIESAALATGRVRLLSDMIQDPAFESVRDDLIKVEHDVYKTLSSNDVAYLGTTKDLPLFKPMFERNLTELSQAAADGASGGGFKKLGAQQVHYLLNFPETTPFTRDDRFPMAVLEALSSETGWKYKDGQYTALRAMDRLGDYFKKAGKKEKEEIKKKIASLLRNTTNFSLIGGAIGWGRIRRGSDLFPLDAKLVQEITLRSAQSLSRNPPGKVESFANTEDDSFDHLVAELVKAASAPKPKEPTVDLPELRALAVRTRLSESGFRPRFETVPSQSGAETLDGFVAWVVKGFRGAFLTTNAFPVLKRVLGAKGLKAKLSKKGAAWAALQDLRRDVKENPSKYMQGNYQDLAKLLE